MSIPENVADQLAVLYGEVAAQEQQAPAPEASEPAPEAETAPASIEPRECRVQSGDTLESIAARVYGDAGRAAEIAALNVAAGRLITPDALIIGGSILLPPDAPATSASDL